MEGQKDGGDCGGGVFESGRVNLMMGARRWGRDEVNWIGGEMVGEMESIEMMSWCGEQR